MSVTLPEVKATYTLAEFAALTGRPKSTVYKQAKSGKLQTVELGAQRVVPLMVVLPIWESIRLAAALTAA